jgi:hypothetical protein
MFDRLLVGEGGFDLDFRIIWNRRHKSAPTDLAISNIFYWLLAVGKSSDKDIGACNDPHCLQWAKCLYVG